MPIAIVWRSRTRQPPAQARTRKRYEAWGGRGSIRSAVRPYRENVANWSSPATIRHARFVPSPDMHVQAAAAFAPSTHLRAWTSHHGPHPQRHARHDAARRHSGVAPGGNRANRRSCNPTVARLGGDGGAGRPDRGPQSADGARHSNRSMTGAAGAEHALLRRRVRY